MELKKIHLGTMSYTMETMDEIASHLETGFAPAAQRRLSTDLQQGGRYKRASRVSNANSIAHGGVFMDGPSRQGGKHRDIAHRVKDIAQALALCHNVGAKL